MYISHVPMRATCISRQLKLTVPVTCFTEYESGVRDERHVTGCHTDNKKTAVWVELWNVSESNTIFLWQGTAAIVPSGFDNKTNGTAYNVQCTMEAKQRSFSEVIRLRRERISACNGKDYVPRYSFLFPVNGLLYELWVKNYERYKYIYIYINSMVWVRERTIHVERPPLVGEVIANFCG
jgi:hypothetical protein